MKAVDFRDLRVWEESMVMAEAIYAVANRLPADERYGLAAQLRRAAVSVPSCIAEGNARSTTRDYLRFLFMARGSLAELQTQLLLAIRLNFAESAAVAPALTRVRAVSLLLQSLIKSLSAKLPGSPHSPFPVPDSRP